MHSLYGGYSASTSHWLKKMKEITLQVQMFKTLTQNGWKYHRCVVKKKTLHTLHYKAAPGNTHSTRSHATGAALPSLEGTHPQTPDIRGKPVKSRTAMCKTSYTGAALSPRTVQMACLSRMMGCRHVWKHGSNVGRELAVGHSFYKAQLMIFDELFCPQPLQP